MSEQSVEGKVIHVLELQSGTSKAGKEWSKKDFVIETDDQYPKKVCFTLFGDKVGLVPDMGEDVKVSYNIESREYNGKWFHNVTAWRIDKVAQKETLTEAPIEPTVEDDAGDLPF